MTPNPTHFIFRLPQTLIRGLGLENFTDLKFIQANIIRNKAHVFKSSELELAVFKLNNLIVNSIEPKSQFEEMNIFESNNSLPSTAIIDFNLLSSHKTFPNLLNIENISVMPYESFVHNPTPEDLIKVISFLRTLKRSYNFSKNVKPLYFYNWADMITLHKSSFFLPWFWKHQDLNLELYLMRIKSIRQNLSKKYSYVNNFLGVSNPILVQLTEWPGSKPIYQTLEDLYSNSEFFRTTIDKGNCTIFLKPHRSIPFYRQFLDDSYRDIPVIKTASLEETLIPTEVFINSNPQKVLLVSEFSSSLFNYQVKNLIGVRNENNAIDFSNIALTASRLPQDPRKYFLSI